MNLEEQLEEVMETVEVSREYRQFQQAAQALAKCIRHEAAQHGYNPDVKNGNLSVQLVDDRGCLHGFTNFAFGEWWVAAGS